MAKGIVLTLRSLRGPMVAPRASKRIRLLSLCPNGSRVCRFAFFFFLFFFKCFFGFCFFFFFFFFFFFAFFFFCFSFPPFCRDTKKGLGVISNMTVFFQMYQFSQTRQK